MKPKSRITPVRQSAGQLLQHDLDRLMWISEDGTWCIGGAGARSDIDIEKDFSYYAAARITELAGPHVRDEHSDEAIWRSGRIFRAFLYADPRRVNPSSSDSFQGRLMPLPDYGVLVGTLNRFTRDDPNEFGSWYHGKMYLQAAEGEYECVIDVSTPSGVPVQYREVRNLDRAQFVLGALKSDWYRLARTPDSGALDYVRSPLLRHRRGFISAMPSPLIEALNTLIRSPHLGWVESTADNALDLLERRLSNCKRVFAFGAPYTVGRGVHDIHMNQGDPPGPFQRLDGIWQDGGTIIESTSGVLDAFLTKFKTQSLNTDDHGLPI